jgi:hypothetical protein
MSTEDLWFVKTFSLLCSYFCPEDGGDAFFRKVLIAYKAEGKG